MPTMGERVIWQRVQDYVARYQPWLIGVTGSTGKSLTCAAVAVALKPFFNVRTSSGQIEHTPMDIALAILGLERPETMWGWSEILVKSLVHELRETEPSHLAVELGARKPGQLPWVVARLPLQTVVVTTIGATHLDYFITPEMIAQEKMTTVVGLPVTGSAILNADDPRVMAMADHTRARVLTYGRSSVADVRLVHSQRLPHFGFACTVQVQGEVHELHLQHIVGSQQLYAILAALAVGISLDLDIPKMVQQLQTFKPPLGRLRLLAGQQGSTILDDSYDATPESMLGALETLRALPSRRRMAIIGDIDGLGRESQAHHAAIGQFAGRIASVVICVGQEMRVAGRAAIRAGADVHHFDTSLDVGKWLVDFLQPDDLVLVKGARSMHMFEIVKRLAA